jgi:catechol 2,3-dioxygenase
MATDDPPRGTPLRPLDPEEVTAAAAPAVAAIPAQTRLGPVHLTVADLARSIAFYERSVGLQTRERDAGRATLGTATSDLLVLWEEPGARPADGFCGLYHVALLVPERADLARWLAHAGRLAVPLVGMADHWVSEAIYLSDPDRHGLEIYADRPRELWEGRVAQGMTTQRLDVHDLLGALGEAAATRFDGLAAGTVVGHVHLRVAELPPTIAFYRDTLGLALMAQLGPYAAFLSAGGYHHHVGANTWESAGAPPAPAGTARLRQATVVLPGPDARDGLVRQVAAAGGDVRLTADGVVVRDPSGNAIELQAP